MGYVPLIVVVMIWTKDGFQLNKPLINDLQPKLV